MGLSGFWTRPHKTCHSGEVRHKSIEIPHQLAPLRLVVSEERGKSGFWKSGWWEAMVQAVDQFLEPILILWKAIPAAPFYHTFPFPFAASTRPKDGRNLTCYFTSCLHFDHFMYSFLGVSLVAHVPIFTIVVPVLHFGWHVLPIHIFFRFAVFQHVCPWLLIDLGPS